MRTSVQKYLGTLIIAVGCLGGLTACSEVLSQYYKTADSAQIAIKHGWLPDILPTSAYNIWEQHDLDTNYGQGHFLFSEEDAQNFQRLLKHAVKFSDLSQNARQSYLHDQEQLKFYRYKDFEFAINWQKHEARFWLIPSIQLDIDS